MNNTLNFHTVINFKIVATARRISVITYLPKYFEIILGRAMQYARIMLTSKQEMFLRKTPKLRYNLRHRTLVESNAIQAHEKRIKIAVNPTNNNTDNHTLSFCQFECFVLVLLNSRCDWFAKLPIRNKIKTNRDLLARVFPRLAPVT